jgi:glycerol uptake facilitator-like aquaporin
MPFKLPQVHVRDAMQDPRLVPSLLGEFGGVLFFQLLAGSVSDSPLQAAFTFAAMSYSLKYVSGGHLNPALSLSAAASGHIDWTRGILYSVAQVLGAVTGAVLQVALVPGQHFGHSGPGCFAPVHGMPLLSLYAWEVMLTAFFILVMYSAIVAEPGHGDVGPLVGGLAIFAAMSTGGSFNGAPINPARVLAGSLVFNCYWRYAWVYLLAHLTAVALCALGAITTYGRGPFYGGAGPRPTEQLRESLLTTDDSALRTNV